jgi:hypothetical protein
MSLSFYLYSLPKDQIWTFNLVYIYGIRGLVFLLNDLTYNVFSFYAICFILYRISCIYDNDI